MSEEFDRLKRVGAQKIYEATYIPVANVFDILEENFENFQKVQLLGFISILEKEYDVDLKPFRETAIAFFDEKSAYNIDECLFAVVDKQKNKNLDYIMGTVVIAILVVLYTLSNSSKTEVKVDDTVIQEVQKTIKPIEHNNTQEAVAIVASVTVEEPIVEEPIVEAVKSFKIVTKSKVWLGYIDFVTNKKKQKTFIGELKLDPNKAWLLVVGHGDIDMYINGEIITLNYIENKYYFYEDGVVRVISYKEFIKLNRGRLW